MRRFAAIFAVFTLVFTISSPIWGQKTPSKDEKPDEGPHIGPVKMVGDTRIFSFKPGDVGHVSKYVYYVYRIESDCLFVRIGTFRFMLIGGDHKGLSTNAPVQLTGQWKVLEPTRDRGSIYLTIEAKSGAKSILR